MTEQKKGLARCPRCNGLGLETVTHDSGPLKGTSFEMWCEDCGGFGLVEVDGPGLPDAEADAILAKSIGGRLYMLGATKTEMREEEIGG